MVTTWRKNDKLRVKSTNIIHRKEEGKRESGRMVVTKSGKTSRESAVFLVTTWRKIEKTLLYSILDRQWAVLTSPHSNRQQADVRRVDLALKSCQWFTHDIAHLLNRKTHASCSL